MIYLIEYLVAYQRYMNLLGIVLLIVVAWFFSQNRKSINFLTVFAALGMQVAIAFAVLHTHTGTWVVEKVSQMVMVLYQAAQAGITFLFGPLSNATTMGGFVFAVSVLPVIIFFGALLNLLFYLGVVSRIVSLLGFVIQPLLGTSGAETLCAVSNSFLGQTEAPLVVRHYLARMTRSELLVVMVSGMGTISGAILAVYAMMGIPLKHLLTASVMAIPATILFAKLLCPETKRAETAAGATPALPHGIHNALEAIAVGTSDGLHLALNVGAMLIAFISGIALLDYLLLLFTQVIQAGLVWWGSLLVLPTLSLKLLLGWLFIPIGWFFGFTGTELVQASACIGTKLVANEMIAYTQLLSAGLSERTMAIMTYALCGFANFSSIGIQIGGIGALVPERRSEIAQLGLYALLGGTLANLLSAMIVGILI